MDGLQEKGDDGSNMYSINNQANRFVNGHLVSFLTLRKLTSLESFFSHFRALYRMKRYTVLQTKFPGGQNAQYRENRSLKSYNNQLAIAVADV